MIDVIYRGDVYLTNLNSDMGSSRARGVRPGVVVSNNVNNRFSTTVHILPITSKIRSNQLPVHVFISQEESGLSRDSLILGEQGVTVDKQALVKKIGHFGYQIMDRVDEAIKIQLGLHGLYRFTYASTLMGDKTP